MKTNHTPSHLWHETLSRCKFLIVAAVVGAMILAGSSYAVPDGKKTFTIPHTNEYPVHGEMEEIK